jgi:glutamine cyclotransferase
MKHYLLPATILLIMCSCGGRGGNASVANRTAEPVQYTYTVKNTYPHDTYAYTQGLYWHDGNLWEGTGQHGESMIRKVDLATGKTLESVSLDTLYFGEGIALLGDKIYQLTWQSGKAFVYDAATLKPVGEFDYKGEGWGLTSDGESLYMSDGTHRIYKINPKDFSRMKTIDVKLGGRTVNYINELEWIDGKIWANVYVSDAVVIIDPESGDVTGVVDLRGILPDEDRRPYTDVLNGIAYDAQGKRIFVTGKYWSKLFEIEIKEKSE